MKRNLIAAIVAVAVFGGTFAFAASLGGVTTGSVGDSATVVASCDTDGVTSTFGAPAWDATGKRYGVSTLSLTSINAACDGDAVHVTLTDSSGAQIEEGSGTVGTPSTGTASVSFSTPVQASAVEGIEVVIAS